MFKDESVFAHRLIKLIDDASEKSIIFSPTSILMGLTMVYIGCEGETAIEIEQLIGKGKSKEEIINQFSSSLNHYKKSNKNAKENVKVNFANKIFIADFCELLPKFCETIEDKFYGGFQQLNFNDNKAATMEINTFVKTETNGLISNMINKDDINKDTAVILVNAIYFKAPWELLFEKFEMIEFNSNSNKKRTIKMMSRQIPESLCWNYLENEKWTSLGIPYEKYKAWIYFVLPNNGYSLKELLEEINDKNFQEWTKRKISPFINVTIPFIDVQYEINMNEKLKKLGLKTAFTDECNAKNMTKTPIYLKKVFHKSVITINEMGTEASAASACFMEARSARKPTHKFLADRPFLYFITTIKEPIDPSKPSTINKEDYLFPEDEEIIFASECSTEPFNLLFVGTFC